MLATYNRCPFDPTTSLPDNPLTWALDSLRGQAGDALAEIVVVNDGSSDHTAAMLEHYQQQPGGPTRAGSRTCRGGPAPTPTTCTYPQPSPMPAVGQPYHCPDPRIGAAHLKFGAVGRYRLHDGDLQTVLPGLGRRLRDLVDLSTAARTDTGCRTSDAMFFPEMIGSFFAFFAARSTAWTVRVWHDFVHAAQVYSQAVATVPPHRERVASWRDGLARAARCLLAEPPAWRECHVQQLLDQVCRTVGQPAIRSWS